MCPKTKPADIVVGFWVKLVHEQVEITALTPRLDKPIRSLDFAKLTAQIKLARAGGHSKLTAASSAELHEMYSPALHPRISRLVGVPQSRIAGWNHLHTLTCVCQKECFPRIVCRFSVINRSVPSPSSLAAKRCGGTMVLSCRVAAGALENP